MGNLKRLVLVIYSAIEKLFPSEFFLVNYDGVQNLGELHFVTSVFNRHFIFF